MGMLSTILSVSEVVLYLKFFYEQSGWKNALIEVMTVLQNLLLTVLCVCKQLKFKYLDHFSVCSCCKFG